MLFSYHMPVCVCCSPIICRCVYVVLLSYAGVCMLFSYHMPVCVCCSPIICRCVYVVLLSHAGVCMLFSCHMPVCVCYSPILCMLCREKGAGDCTDERDFDSSLSWRQKEAGVDKRNEECCKQARMKEEETVILFIVLRKERTYSSMIQQFVPGRPLIGG